MPAHTLMFRVRWIRLSAKHGRAGVLGRWTLDPVAGVRYDYERQMQQQES